MKKLAFLLGIGLLILLIGQAKGYEQVLYHTSSSSASDFNITAFINVSSDLETCNTNLRVYADILPPTPVFTSYQFFLYKNGVQTSSTIYNTISSATCITILNQTTSGGFMNVTARALSLGTAVPVNLYFEIDTSCGQIDNSTVYITDNEAPVYLVKNSSNNMYLQPYYDLFGTPTPNTSWANVTPSHCVPNTHKIPAIPFHVYNANSTNAIYFVPFYSGLGIVQIQWKFYIDINTGIKVGVLNTETLQSTTLASLTNPTSYYNASISLLPDSNYVAWLLIGRTSGDGILPPPIINITITDTVPNYVCGNFSECINHIQSRTCIDTKSIFPNTVQTRSCLRFNETAILGFENYYIPSDRWVCQPIYSPFCALHGTFICLGGVTAEDCGSLANVTVLFPDNPRWSILPDNPLYYIATINSETATLGSRSLKLWYIPQSPFSDQPVNNNGTIECLNTTTGTYPVIQLPVNTSFMVSLNFTFPSDTTQLKFDVKRCPENVIQYNNWCGKRCYSQNCSIEPSGDFIVNLYDQVLGTNMFQLTKEATTNWTTFTVEIGSNAVVDRNYTLSFSVLPLPINPTTTEGNCVYFDNVRLVNSAVSLPDEWANELYNSTWAELTNDEKQTVLLQKCVNQCIGNDYHIRTIQELTCIEEVQLNYSTCVTQQQQQQTGNQSIFLPISSIANAIVNTTTNQTLSQSMTAQGLGFVLVFLTPIFWLVIFIIAVMMVVSHYTKHMEIGGVSGLLLLVGFAVYFPELIWITIVVIIIAGFIIGRMIVRVVQGG